MGHWPGIPQPGHVRHGCVGSNVHEYALRGKRPFTAVAQSNLESPLFDEPSIAENQFSSRCVVLIEMEPDKVVNHLTLSCVHSSHIDGYCSCMYPELRLSPEQRGDLTRADAVLAGQAGHVRTGSADELPFDHACFLALPGHRPPSQF